MIKKAGVRFDPKNYIEIEADLEDVPQSTIKTIVDGVETEYSLGGGGGGATGSSALDLRSFPHTMTAGNTYQINYTLSDGATIEFSSNASNSKISVDESGLMTCIGSTTGACVITITTKNSDGNVINETKMKISVA